MSDPGIYRRGLTFEEVAFIKAAAARGFARDYIMGFLMYPGRTLSPACINDIVVQNVAPDVPSATQEELDHFISRRLSHQKSFTEAPARGPLSTYLVHQELGWALSDQDTLFETEGRRLELKRALPKSNSELSKCMIAAAALANADGGYLIFGIEDKKRTVLGITSDSWETFDWNKFASETARLFQPSIGWERRCIEYHGYQLGVIYVEPLELPPTVATADWNEVTSGSIYFRYPRSSERIRFGDLLRLLAKRDDHVRKRLAA